MMEVYLIKMRGKKARGFLERNAPFIMVGIVLYYFFGGNLLGGDSGGEVDLSGVDLSGEVDLPEESSFSNISTTYESYTIDESWKDESIFDTSILDSGDLLE